MLTSERAWRLSPDGLSIATPQLAADPGATEVFLKADESVFLIEVGYLLSGGLISGRVSEVVPAAPRVRGDRWTMIATHPGRDAQGEPYYAVEFSGDWDATAHRGFVRDMTIVAHWDSKNIGARTMFEDWTLNESLGLWVARRATEFDRRGRRTRTIEFDTVFETGKNFSELTELPGPSSGDVLRKSPNLTVVADYRTNELTKTKPDGSVMKQELSASARGTRTWLTWAGWGILCAVLGAT